MKTTLIDWLKLSCVHIGFCVDTGFSYVSLCEEFFFSQDSYFSDKETFVSYFKRALVSNQGFK